MVSKFLSSIWGRKGKDKKIQGPQVQDQAAEKNVTTVRIPDRQRPYSEFILSPTIRDPVEFNYSPVPSSSSGTSRFCTALLTPPTSLSNGRASPTPVGYRALQRASYCPLTPESSHAPSTSAAGSPGGSNSCSHSSVSSSNYEQSTTKAQTTNDELQSTVPHLSTQQWLQELHRQLGRQTTLEEEDDMLLKSTQSDSWEVQYLGSFPISNTNAEHVSYRLDKFKPLPPFRSVQLSLSVLGVKVSQEKVLLAHSLRRVLSVVTRGNVNEIAYIAVEPAGQTYRRQCHVFRTKEIFEVAEIEQSLGACFQAAYLARKGSAAAANTSAAQRSASTAHLPRSTPSGFRNSVACTPTRKSTSILPHVDTPMPMPIGEKQRVSSSAFLSRLLGKGRELNLEDLKGKRKRPVSAVFTNAIHRFSSSTMATKRMSTAELPRREPLKKPLADPSRLSSVVSPSTVTPPLAEQEDTSSTGGSHAPSSIKTSTIVQNAPSSLVFDEKIGEWIYPIDENLEAQLEQVAYFCKLPSRETVLRNLQTQPEGAFVLRYSESKRRCLALSVRVPVSHNANCVSHYLVIRNEKGYRIRGFSKHFPSIQMLITHHSVMQEQLPCRLIFVQWARHDWKDQREVTRDSSSCGSAENGDCREGRERKDARQPMRDIHHEVIPEDRSTSIRGSKVFPETDENRNTCFYDEHFVRKLHELEKKESQGSLATSTPKRRSRQFDNRRHSRFFDLD